MYMLQLFDADGGAQPIDARLFDEGVLGIGRDPTSDWPIVDTDCALSRAHCELHANPDGLSVRALGANGVFDDGTGQRLPDGELRQLPIPTSLRMGRFRLVASQAPDMNNVVRAGTLILSPPLGTSSDVPNEWSDGAARAPTGEGSLFEAFCEGAQLDSSLLSSEDPQEIMRRAGALYRQMVLGIGDLMSERAEARSRYHLTRTTIGGEANNPFKWAPSQRLAIDLLLAGSTSFLSGPAALQASFRDIKRHLIATFAGLQGAMRHAIESFSPQDIDQAVAAKTSLLKSRTALQAEEVERRHADLAAQLEGSSGSLDKAFVTAYESADSGLKPGKLA
jgi:predicted component of type VI protein secretion system